MARTLLVVALAVTVAAAAAAAAATPWAAAQVRAVAVVSTTMELDVLASTTRALTREPRVEELELAGSPTSLFRPGRGDGPWPALLFVNGATQHGRQEPTVRRLAEGLARTGHLVAVPDLPGLRQLTLVEEAVDATEAAVEALAGRDDVEDGRVGLVAVSLGGTLALLAAQRDGLRERLTVVSGIAPFTDLRETIRLATTRHHRIDERLLPHATDPFVREVVEDSLTAIVPRPRPPELAELLENSEPERFDELYEQAPEGLREPVERLSPVRESERLATRVELVSGPDDRYFPPEQTQLLTERAPDARLTLTRVLDHADLHFSLLQPGDALRFNGFVVRTLVEARR